MTICMINCDEVGVMNHLVIQLFVRVDCSSVGE